MNRKIVILGAGPTGLGAAYRLNELKIRNFIVLEKENYVGGLATSFKDEKKFTWDVGGHVIHSHFSYFDKVLKQSLGPHKFSKKRYAYVFFRNNLIPYPFQNNIHLLPSSIFLKGLWQILIKKQKNKPKNFLELIYSKFGAEIAKQFLIPYNKKVWDYPLSKMDTGWITERVSTPSFWQIMRKILLNDSDKWGPNAKFIYPRYGTGMLWQNIASSIDKSNIKLNSSVQKIDAGKKVLYLKNGSKVIYDKLISSIPLDFLIDILNSKPKAIQSASHNLKHNSVIFYGFGVKKRLSNKTSWIYYPQKNIPFYRVTYLSNYSEYLTPDKSLSSVLTESVVNNRSTTKNDIIEGLLHANVFTKKDVNNIKSIWSYKIDYAYPIPTIMRDKSLESIQKFLAAKSIFSRGRFGTWKYEISNMDHSFMQGKEIVDKIILGKKETVWSL